MLGWPLKRIGGTRVQRTFHFPAEAAADFASYHTDDKPVSARRLFSARRDLMAAMARLP